MKRQKLEILPQKEPENISVCAVLASNLGRGAALYSGVRERQKIPTNSDNMVLELLATGKFVFTACNPLV